MKYSNIQRNNNLYTTKEIAECVNRSPVTVSSLFNRLQIKPIGFEKLSGSLYKNFYSEAQKDKIITHYLELDMTYNKRRKTLFPEVIYVTRTTEIINSVLEFLNYEECLKSISVSKINH